MTGMRFTILSVLLLGISATSSASNLGWGSTTFSKDTLYLGDTLYITSFLKNYDSQPYNDTVRFSLKINGILNVNPNIFPNPFPNQPLNIPGNDSLPANLRIIITPAYFLVGPDILVVWPRANDGSMAHDSIIKTIIVLDPTSTGVHDKEDKGLRGWCFNGFLHIETSEPEIHLNRVRIFNSQGNEIFASYLKERNSIPFDNQPNGIYFAEIMYNSTERKIIKFINY